MRNVRFFVGEEDDTRDENEDGNENEEERPGGIGVY